MSSSTLDTSTPKDAHIDERLRNELIIWFGSVRPDNRPHLIPVWFLWDGEAIYVFSKPDQKIRNLRENNKVIIALDNSDTGEDVVLLEGEATILDSSAISTADPRYVAKYQAKLTSMNWTGESMAQEYNQPIRVQPTRFMFR